MQVDRGAQTAACTAQPAVIRVRAPATSANLGPGFDCLGLALDLWNDVAATPGIGAADNQANLILRSARAVYDLVGAPYPGFELHCTNRIPMGRGLGSSSSAIVCGLLLANAYLGEPLPTSGLLRLAAAIEGHPDNVVPCLLGGVRVATLSDAGDIIQVGIAPSMRLRAVIFVPDQGVPTVQARGLLPKQVPLRDALFNVARASLLVAALASGQVDALREATRDRLHQRYRLPLFPAGATLLEAAMQAGALGACMSGAGPSVLALCADSSQTADVQAGMQEAAERLEVSGTTLDLSLSRSGAHVVD